MSSTPALTPISKPNPLNLNYVYTTSTDICNFTHVIVANNSGILVDSSLATIIVPNAFNALNDLFVASDASTNWVPTSTNYLTYYNANNFVKSPTDLTVTTIPSTPINGITVDASANTVKFANTIASGSSSSADVSAQLVANMPFYQVNKTVRNGINVRVYPISINTSNSSKVINATSTLGTQNKFTFNVAAVSPSAYLLIENDIDSVNSYISTDAWPKVQASMAPMLLNSSIPVPQGYNSVDVVFNVPTNLIGTWFWKVSLVDPTASVAPSPVLISVQLVPTFTQPVTNFSNGTYNVTKDLSNVSVKLQYANADYNTDISNYVGTKDGLKYDFRLYPNNVTTAALSDVNNFTLKLNGTGTNLLDVIRDVSNGARTLADLVTASQTLGRVDLSLNGQKYYDISKNYVLNYTGATEYSLTTTSYTLAMDWANRNNADGSVTTNIATINITPTYVNNATITNLLNGLYRLSYSQPSLASDSRFWIQYLDNSNNTIGSFEMRRPDVSSNSVISLDMSANFVGYPSAKKMVAYVGTASNAYLYTNSNSQSISNIFVPKMSVTVLDGSGNTFNQININDVAMLADGLDTNNAAIINQLQDNDISGYYVRDFNIGVDFTAALQLPVWFQTIQNPQVTFTIIDNNQCMSKFDISSGVAGLPLLTSTGTTVKTVALNDISGFRNMTIDITFNTTSAPTTFQLNWSFTGIINGMAQTFNSDTVVFYVPEAQEYVASNRGSYYNYLYVNNGCKLSLDTGVGMSLAAVDPCLNYVWRNLATSVNNRYDINLARPEFYPVSPTPHQFIYTGITMNAVALSSACQKPRAFFSFAKAAKDVNTAVACTGMDSGFATLPYTFIQLNNFVGYIDITYNTIKDGLVSQNPNILRLFVLPRPAVNVTVADPSSNLLPRSTATINYSITNVQMNGSTPITFDTCGNYYTGLTSPRNPGQLSDASFNSLLNSKTISYLKICNGVVSVDPLPALFDVCQNNTAIISYGVTANNTFLFKGFDTSTNRIFNENLIGRYTNMNVPLSGSAPFVITILTNNSNTLANCIYANCIQAYKCLKINNIHIAKYEQADGVSIGSVTSPYILDASCNSTTLWLFVQNISINKNVIVSTTASANPSDPKNSVFGLAGATPGIYNTSMIIAPGKRAAYYRLSPDTWSYFGLI